MMVCWWVSDTPQIRYWIDDCREVFETVADVEEMMAMVYALEAEILLEKIRKGSYYRDDPVTNQVTISGRLHIVTS
jgi:hypothetical protein